MVSSVPVIDIFAGTGGLSEGFSAFSRTSFVQPFRIKLSIEKDSIAHSTLLLRAFFRQFQLRRKSVPMAFYSAPIGVNKDGKAQKLVKG
jgi:DNA (cytosine-5)-methyltransferase 1